MRPTSLPGLPPITSLVPLIRIPVFHLHPAVIHLGVRPERERMQMIIRPTYWSTAALRFQKAVSTDTKQHHDMAVILDAPDWFIAMKRQKWNNVLVLSAESILPQGSDYPFILVCKRSHSKRIVYSMVTEIDGFAEWWEMKNDKSSEMA